MSETKVVTKELVRFSYVNLEEAKAAPGATEAKFSMSAIIPKTAKKTLKLIDEASEAARKQGVEKYGSKWKAKKLPLRDGDEEREDDAYKNSFFVNASNKTRPVVVDRNVDKILDLSEVKSGDWGNLVLNFYPFNVNGNMGIGCSLNQVQKVKDGEPLGGSAGKPEDNFAKFEDDDDIM